MIVPVIWWNANPAAIARGYWDQGLLESLFSGEAWQLPFDLTFQHHVAGQPEGEDIMAIGWESGAHGAVVVVPGQHNAHLIDALNRDLAQLDWCVVIVTGDEQALFPYPELSHPRMLVWAQTPRSREDWKPDMAFGWGAPPWFRAARPGYVEGSVLRRHAWSFAGQVTTDRRREMAEAVEGLRGYDNFLGTEGFAQGLDHDQYAELMEQTQVALCPAGRDSPDSFRFYEALEAGAYPVVDTGPIGRAVNDPGYWTRIWGEPFPFPVVRQWRDVRDLLGEIIEGGRWAGLAARGDAWWQGHKRRLAYQLARHVQQLSGHELEPGGTASDHVTVIVTTSPIPSHPSTEVIEETLRSVRHHLPTADVIVVADGLRPEQVDQQDAYDEYLRRLARLCDRMPNVVPLFLPEWVHQANATRAALERVATPLILFMEHDTPLETAADLPIEWDRLVRLVESGEFNLVRFHHESQVLREHEYLMIPPAKRGVDDAAKIVWPTRQWSQRPHLASLRFYQERVMPEFPPKCRTMIEDVMYGVVQENGTPGWWDWRLAIYTPRFAGQNIRRSYHLDGRAGAEKFDGDMHL